MEYLILIVKVVSKDITGDDVGNYIQIFAAAVAIMAIAFNTFTNQRNKRSDIIVHCNNRYDEIYKYKIEISDTNKNSKNGKKYKNGESVVNQRVISYFRRYFGLKSDQVDYWLSGYVDPETIISWFWSTMEAFVAKPADKNSGKKNDNADNQETVSHVQGMTYEAGWSKVRESHEYINPRLYKLIEVIIHDISKESDPEVRYAKLYCELERIERKEKALIRMLSSPVPFITVLSFRKKMRVLVGTLSPNIQRRIRQTRKEQKWQRLYN